MLWHLLLGSDARDPDPAPFPRKTQGKVTGFLVPILQKSTSSSQKHSEVTSNNTISKELHYLRQGQS